MKEEVFVNLTNHNSACWCKKQFEAASQYGRIIDYPFPHVSEEFNLD